MKIKRKLTILFSSKIMNGEKVDLGRNFKRLLELFLMITLSAQRQLFEKKLLFTSAHCFLDFEEVTLKMATLKLLMSYLEFLEEDFCTSYQECLEELNLMTWKSTKRRFLDDHLEEIINQFQIHHDPSRSWFPWRRSRQ